MKFFSKYYFWTIIILVISYCYSFFGPITPLVKGVDNLFLLVFPVIVVTMMIRNYPFQKKLSYPIKFAIMAIYFLFVMAFNFLLGQWNPAGMEMNQNEKDVGQIGIIAIYGTFLFILGTITIIFIRPKNIVK